MPKICITGPTTWFAKHSLKQGEQIEYKAQLAGITVHRMTEEYTSQRCSHCSMVDKRSRKHRGLYVCRHCAVILNADVNAAQNLVVKYLIESKLQNPSAYVHSKYPRDVQAFLRAQGISGCVTQPVCLAIHS